MLRSKSRDQKDKDKEFIQLFDEPQKRSLLDVITETIEKLGKVTELEIVFC